MMSNTHIIQLLVFMVFAFVRLIDYKKSFSGSIIMWRIIAIALIICAFCATRTLGNARLKISLEYFNLTYSNKRFTEFHARSVSVNKNTKKIRVSAFFKFDLGDNLQLHGASYRITKDNKQYLMLRGSRPVRDLMHLAESEFATSDFRSHWIPDLYWPIKTNVTYTLRDWWLKHSQAPFELATGRFKGVWSLKYPNNTIITVVVTIVNIFNSNENFD